MWVYVVPAAGSIHSAAAEGLKAEESSTPFPQLNPEHPAQHKLMWVTHVRTQTQASSTVTLNGFFFLPFA